MPLGLNNTYSLLLEVDLDDVMSGYDVGYDAELKYKDFISPASSMVATAADVGKFLRALNDGSLLNEKEQAIYSSIYEYEHTGLLPGYSWNVSEIVYARIVKILKRETSS